MPESPIRKLVPFAEDAKKTAAEEGAGNNQCDDDQSPGTEIPEVAERQSEAQQHDADPKKLLGDADVQEFYLGLHAEGARKSFRDIKHYKRRKRWLS